MADFRKMERAIIDALDVQGFDVSDNGGDIILKMHRGCPLAMAGACAMPEIDTPYLLSITEIAKRLSEI